ncbi:oligosaccharide flippase family protein [Thalassotalea sp. PLHSN55]|uniref:oligosaccharide flippase family protein n=1 Tax=Thalassotalea sp. PLHSN55 TaxID=3435888 RepID=UPI003F852E09
MSSVANKARSGIKWGAFGKITNQFFSWIATIWVIRLLTPDDFALIALNDLAIGVLLIVGQFGLGGTLIRTPELSRQSINQTFSVLMLANIVLFVVFQFSAPFFAQLFEQPKLTLLIQVSALSFLFGPFITVHKALINRNMQYKQLNLVDIGISFGQILTNLTLALLGYGFWALAVGLLVAQFLRVVCYRMVSQTSLSLTASFNGFIPLVKDGSLNFFHSTGWEINQRLDTLLINTFSGSNALGIYRVVLSLAEKPVTMVGQLIQQVGLSSFAKVSHDKALVSHYVVKSSAVLAMAIFPVFFGIAAVAPNLVPLLLGDKWLTAIVPLQIICMVQMINALRVIPGSALYASGFAKRKLLHVSVAFFCALIGWGVGLQYSLNVGCLLFAAMYVVWFIWHIFDSCRCLPIAALDYWKSLLIPLFLSAVMFISVTSVGEVLSTNIIVELVIQVLLGGVIYGGLLLLLFKEYGLGLLSLLKKS